MLMVLEVRAAGSWQNSLYHGEGLTKHGYSVIVIFSATIYYLHSLCEHFHLLSVLTHALITEENYVCVAERED